MHRSICVIRILLGIGFCLFSPAKSDKNFRNVNYVLGIVRFSFWTNDTYPIYVRRPTWLRNRVKVLWEYFTVTNSRLGPVFSEFLINTPRLEIARRARCARICRCILHLASATKRVKRFPFSVFGA